MIEGRTVLAWVGIGVLAAAVPAGALDLFVDASAGSDANDGLSWATAKASVGAAVALAGTNPGPHTISVAAGVYGETVEVPADTALLGGFPPGGGARDPAANGTVLDGGGTGPVVSFGPETDASALDGFTVRGGRNLTPGGAGGIVIRGSGASVREVLVEGNDGCLAGGVLVDASGTLSLPSLSGSLVRGNRDLACPVEIGGPGAGGVTVIIDWDASTAAPILDNVVVEGNRKEEGTDDRFAGGVFVHGGVGINGLRSRRNSGSGLVLLDGFLKCFNCEFTGNSTRGAFAGCPVRLVLENTTFSGNGHGSIGWLDLITVPEARVELDVSRSILWEVGGEPIQTDRPPCGDFPTFTVRDSIVRRGFPGGTNVLDADPLFASGPAGDSYLGQTAAGQPQDSPALDAGPVLAADVGLDALTTRTDSVTDAGLVDWGVHYPVFPQLTVLRSTDPAALAPHATLQNLPFTDGPGVLDDPLLPLLFYRVEPADNPVRVEKDLTASTVRLAF